MDNVIQNHPIKITIGAFIMLLISIAYNFFGAGEELTNAKRDIVDNANAISTVKTSVDKMEKKLDSIYDGLLYKGIIEPQK